MQSKNGDRKSKSGVELRWEVLDNGYNEKLEELIVEPDK
jgi:hypothetical protein